MKNKSNLASFQKFLTGFGAELKKHGIKLAEKEESEQLMLLYAYYKYFNANSADIPELIAGDIYEGGYTSGLGGVYIDVYSDNDNNDDSDDDEIHVLYPICCQGNQCYFRDADKTVANIENYIFNPVLRPRKLNKFLEDKDINLKNRKIKIIIVTNTNLNNKLRNDLQYKLSKLQKDRITHEIIVGREILSTIINIESPKPFVEEGEIEIDANKNILSFGEEHSLIVNISAKSLQELYQSCFTKGLFSQNLRGYIKNKEIDSDIVKSIQNSNDLFWYLNNGIIIICNDFKLINKKITLSKFSIINGGQTTYLIGNTDFEKDFYLQCKIIKNTKVKEAEKQEFISSVAKATNSQKPIKQKDIIANKTEQRMLKKQLDDVGIFCGIKRGDTPIKLKYKEPWQSTTNDDIAQLLVSFMYLKPGIVRSNKAKLFKDKYYNLIFGNEKTYNALLLKDLLKIKCAYKTYKNNITKADFLEDTYKLKLTNYGTYFTVSLIGIIAKLFYHVFYNNRILSISSLEEQHAFLSKFDLSHPIFRFDIEEKDFYWLFDLVYNNFYKKGYEDYISGNTNNDYSNFTKTDNYFVRNVFKNVISSIKSGDMQIILKEFSEIAYTPSKEDVNNDNTLLAKFY